MYGDRKMMEENSLSVNRSTPFSRGSSFRHSRRRPTSIFYNIRQQLTDQLKSLEMRLDMQVSMVSELQDFFRRRAEIEMEYSRSLEKLVKSIMVKHKAEKQRREQWPQFSTYTAWQHLLGFTRKESKDHQLLGDIYNTQMCYRLGDIMDDTGRMYRKCREVAMESHEEIYKVLTELQSALKTYHIYHTESKQAENKLKSAEHQKLKVEQQTGKGTVSRKYKAVEKETEKRQLKYQENKVRSLKARNEYLMCIDAANAANRKYFVEDLSDIIDCMDHGYHNALQRSMLLYLSCEEGLQKSRADRVQRMNQCIGDLDARTDKQNFLEANSALFSLPKKFEFQSHKGDEICQISAQKSVQDELIQRFESMNSRLNQLKLENDETWKSFEEADKSLITMINVKDYEVSELFVESNQPPKSPQDREKRSRDRLELEDYYMKKFRAYIIQGDLSVRLTAKKNAIQKAIGDGVVSKSARPPSLPPKPRKKRIGKAPLVGQPKLFGGSLEEYIEATNQDIPPVIKSCVRVINLHGMHHMGVFRVSGAIPEINEFKAAFEKGEDPLVDVTDGNCINSVAGLLKLFFRELREPLFPLQLFDALIDCSQLENTEECIERLRELISSLPRTIVVVMRYLFAFLNHLSEFSDENMMEPYNLAICFGPTLLPIPADKDQVAYQNNVNDLIKFIIVHQEVIFPRDGGEVYEKCIMDVIDTGEVSDDEDVANLSEDESDNMDAVALYDFEGRTGRELSFKKGAVLSVFAQVNNDWWEGSYDGREGLIPDAYVTLKAKEEPNLMGSSMTSSIIPEVENVKAEDKVEKRLSTESLPAKPFALHDPQLEKSSSHPNISTTTISTDNTSEAEELQSPPPLPPRGAPFSSMDMSTQELNQELESALASVMEDLESLQTSAAQQQQQGYSKPKSKPLPPHPKHTPDLVLDLPEGSNDQQSDPEDSAVISGAETFAKSNQSTMKKACSLPRSTTHSSAFRQGHGGGGGGDETDNGGPGRGIKRSTSTNATMMSRHHLTPGVEPSVPEDGGAMQDGNRSPSVEQLRRAIAPVMEGKLNPPLKFRPPIMKKPTRSPEPMPKPQTATKKGEGSTAL